ncbi:MAG TPA: hypothetical protein VH107_08010 [Lacipirellulaceae bacterium]|jgi:hypothetical protein|nr:hypothetical protein [Lacipirellulaceae bacterium]
MANRLPKPPTGKIQLIVGIVFLVVAAVFCYLGLSNSGKPIALVPAAICLLAGVLNLWLAKHPQK